MNVSVGVAAFDIGSDTGGVAVAGFGFDADADADADAALGFADFGAGSGVGVHDDGGDRRCTAVVGVFGSCFGVDVDVNVGGCVCVESGVATQRRYLNGLKLSLLKIDS
jgi:hypothetical protein